MLLYKKDRETLVSPWYHTAPLIAKGINGAIIPLYIDEGVKTVILRDNSLTCSSSPMT